MGTALANRQQNSASDQLESVLVGGDLSKLSTEGRLEYYAKMCNSLGLNPLTRPFDYITLNGRLVLYAKKDATDQLRQMHNISITALDRATVSDVYMVTAYASTPTGRQDTSIGAVSIKGLQGDALANALMKAETKAKRRVTLSICGLGLLDETELDTIPQAQPPRYTTPTRTVEDEVPAVPYREVAELQPAAPPQVDELEFDRVPVSNPNDAAVTEKQVKAIYAIGRAARRMSEQDVDTRCIEVFGVRPAELTKREASQFIDSLKAE